MSLTSRMVTLDDAAEGGFVRSKRLGGDKRRRKASSHQPVVDQADLEAARERWSGVLPMVVVRDMAANLSDELASSLMGQVGPLDVEIQEVLVGELAQLDSSDLQAAIATGVLATRIEQLKSEAAEAVA